MKTRDIGRFKISARATPVGERWGGAWKLAPIVGQPDPATHSEKQVSGTYWTQSEAVSAAFFEALEEAEERNRSCNDVFVDIWA
jgi:hypothetical protein